MSYDLFVFKPRPGENPIDTIDELQGIDEEADWIASPDASNPLNEFAVLFESSLDDVAMCDVSDYVAHVMIPYHYDGREAQAVFGSVLECVREAATRWGLVAFDPQTGEMVDLDRGCEPMLQKQQWGRNVVREMEQADRDSSMHPKRDRPRKPWWRLW